MIGDEDLRRLDELVVRANADGDDFRREIERVGSTVENLAVIVDRFGSSESPRITQIVAFQIARSLWDIEPRDRRLTDVVLTLLRATAQTTDPATLTNCLTALQALSAQGLLALERDEDRVSVTGCLVRSLTVPDPVLRSYGLGVAAHLVAESPGSISESGISAIRSAVKVIESSDGPMFQDEIDELRKLFSGP